MLLNGKLFPAIFGGVKQKIMIQEKSYLIYFSEASSSLLYTRVKGMLSKQSVSMGIPELQQNEEPKLIKHDLTNNKLRVVCLIKDQKLKKKNQHLKVIKFNVYSVQRPLEKLQLPSEASKASRCKKY